MIPIRDTTKSRTIPYVNYGLITVCGLVFLYELSLGHRLDHFIRVFGIVPYRISAAVFQDHFVLRPLLPLLTSMFLHGGWLHLLGNMLYLYIFGDNIEDRIGHVGYLFFFLLSGIGASLVQVYSNQISDVPVIGASGAIAGVLGAYFLLFPKARILTMIPLFVFFPVVELSAFFFLGFWFLMQFLEGTASAAAGTTGGGVAWWAHAGGFLVGAILLPVFLLFRKVTR